MSSSIVNLGGSQGQLKSMQRYPSSGILLQETHQAFIDDLVSNSMMFKHFKEDNARGLTDETVKLIQMQADQRRNYLFTKFNTISSQAQYPLRYDNERKWIRYYDRANNHRKKYRFNRYSLNMLDGSTIFNTSMPSTASLVASPLMNENRLALTHSTVFQ
jgi:hypothetical protein